MRISSLGLLGVMATAAALAACSGGSEQAPSGSGGSAAAGAGGSNGGASGAAGSAGSMAGAAGDAGSAGSMAGAGGSAMTQCGELNMGNVGFEIGQTLPDLALTQVAAGAQETPLTLYDYGKSLCEQGKRILVLRFSAPFCATCDYEAKGLGEAWQGFDGTAVQLTTLLYASRYNGPPRAQDLLGWKASHPSLPGELMLTRDLEALRYVRAVPRLPAAYVLDTATMKLFSTHEDPSRQFLSETAAFRLEQLDGTKVTTLTDPTERYDGLFTPKEWALIQAMKNDKPPPPDTSNQYGDSAAAAALGQVLFNLSDLTGTGNVGCASCHQADKGFADGLPVAKGVADGSIHTPAIAMSAYSPFQFWDGRADSLWSQALGPFENPLEINGSRLEVVHRVFASHKMQYEGIFGPMPDFSDMQRFPATGKPGEASFDNMAPADQELVNRAYVNVGKAIAAFERTLKPAANPLSDYASGNKAAFTASEKAGLKSFFVAGCINCHHGPTLSDQAFHNILAPSHMGPGDRGRIDGLPALMSSPFRRSGSYSDDPQGASELDGMLSDERLLGQMKTPSLLDLNASGPYGHGGTFSKLTDLLKHYTRQPMDAPPPDRVVGKFDAAMLKFHYNDTTNRIEDLEAFLLAVGGKPKN